MQPSTRFSSWNPILRSLAATSIASLTGLLCTAPLIADTFVVDITTDSVDSSPGNGVCADVGGNCSLRAAVMEANALAGADTIVLGAEQYELSIASCGVESNESDPAYEPGCGDLDIQSDITIQGAGAYRTLIDGEPMRPVPGYYYNSGHFDVDSSGILRLHDLMLHGAANRGSGGSIRNSGGRLWLFDTVLFANEASFSGGAIDTRNGTAHIERCLLALNHALTASIGGGAIFHGNTQIPPSGPSLTIIDSTLWANRAEADTSPNNDGNGGGISLGTDALADLQQVTIVDNIAHGKGGGIYVSGGSHSMTLEGSTIAGNRADVDGDATTSQNGGGLWSNNTAGMIVRNSILGDNQDSHHTIGVGDCGGSLNIVEYSLLEDSSCTYTGSNNITHQDPELLLVTNRGGPVPTVALEPTSPAIDAANAANCSAADARGRDRVVGLGCDMGAFESGQEPIFQIQVGADFADIDVGDGGCWTFHPVLGSFAWVCTLRAAMQEASEHSGTTTIELGAGTYRLFDLGGVSDDLGLDGDLDLHGNGTAIVLGAGADQTTIRQDGSDRVFDLPTGGGRLEIHGVEVRGGRVIANEVGGNIRVDGGGELLLSEVRLSDGHGGDGGAIAALSGSVEIERSTLDTHMALGTQDSPGDGGAIFFDGSQLDIRNSTVHNNSATGNGGGIAVLGGSYDLDAITVTSNLADSDTNGIGNGGGLYSFEEESGSTFGSVIAQNTDNGGETPDCSGLTDSEGYNLIGAHTGCGFLSTGDLIGSTASPLSPQLAALADNGGPTPTRLPLPGSPLIDANLDLLDCPATDQRGAPRPIDGNGDSLADCDIGAVELGEAPLFADGFESGDTAAW